MWNKLAQLIFMLLALGISSLPAFCFARTPAGREAELISWQTAGNLEFIPVNLETEILLPESESLFLTRQQATSLLPVNAGTRQIALCKKAGSFGKYFTCFPLRL